MGRTVFIWRTGREAIGLKTRMTGSTQVYNAMTVHSIARINIRETVHTVPKVQGARSKCQGT